ncbi:hypothetical protein ABZ446_28640 [Streptomyces sp. NPDC005813]|uniref:hypothetical protein n=1 Tax=Streptomyces sp. NPDC005813 TaxID=3155592 RepID=UPI0033CDE4B2
MEFKTEGLYGDPAIEVSRDYDGDVILRPTDGTVYLDDAGAREFARKLLALVGDEATTSAEPTPAKVGDRVEITKYRSDDRSHVGRVGTVREVDTDHIPFLVHVDGYGGVWAMEVRKVATSATSHRTDRLDEARRIAGPDATPADVLAYAKYLDGE